ncbi:ecdysone-induced protein 75B, isoforms C/D-like isoform X2 [Arapaima gigas]
MAISHPRTCKLPDLLLPDHHLNRPALWTTGTSSICSLSLDSPKVHTPCPTDSCPQCLVGDKEARVLVILLGVTLIICAALLVSTVVLATQLCQQQQWRPNPRPLRSNTSFIRAQEERANGSPDRGWVLESTAEKSPRKKSPCWPETPALHGEEKGLAEDDITKLVWKPICKSLYVSREMLFKVCTTFLLVAIMMKHSKPATLHPAIQTNSTVKNGTSGSSATTSQTCNSSAPCLSAGYTTIPLVLGLTSTVVHQLMVP